MKRGAFKKLLIQILRWSMGYISFELIGNDPEKFINLAVKNKINLWDLKKYENILCGKILASDYKLLKKLAKSSHSKICLKTKIGFPFFRTKYKKRLGFVVGAILFFLINYLLSLCIWDVKVSGNENIPVQDILNVAKDIGVYPGRLKKDIDFALAEEETMMKLGNIAWISMNSVGSCVEISVKEKIEEPNILKPGEPCNIIATEDGKIDFVEAYKGTACVSSGDVVVKGQLLISGVVEDLNYQNSFVDAEGKVYAKTVHKISEEVKTSKVCAVDTGKKIKRCRIKILNWELPIGFWKKIDDNYRSEIVDNKLKIFNKELPLSFCLEKWYEQQCDEILISPEDAIAEAEKNISCRESEELKNIKILEKHSEKREQNGQYTVEIVYTCLEDIGKKEKIMFQS